jgi:hypothetical protein
LHHLGAKAPFELNIITKIPGKIEHYSLLATLVVKKKGATTTRTCCASTLQQGGNNSSTFTISKAKYPLYKYFLNIFVVIYY